MTAIGLVSKEIVAEALGPGWRKITEKVPEEGLPKGIGRERVVVWQRVEEGNEG